MKKIYPIYERLVCIFSLILLSVITVILFAKNNSTIILYIIVACVIFIVASLLKLFSIPSHIIIEDNRVKVFDFPFLATDEFYVKKRGLILYNNEINIDDVKKIELVQLNKEEQKKYIGYKHLFGKYLKFNLKYGNPKYVYVGNYSNDQVQKIIELANNK